MMYHGKKSGLFSLPLRNYTKNSQCVQTPVPSETTKIAHVIQYAEVPMCTCHFITHNVKNVYSRVNTRAGGVAQVVKRLPSKCEALSSSPSAKGKKKKKAKG
jgi:hypothetical protein